MENVCSFWSSKDKKLYRCSFGGLYLLCLHPSKTVELLVELHEGIYGRHLGGKITSPPSHDSRILVAKYASRCG